MRTTFLGILAVGAALAQACGGGEDSKGSGGAGAGGSTSDAATGGASGSGGSAGSSMVGKKCTTDAECGSLATCQEDPKASANAADESSCKRIVASCSECTAEEYCGVSLATYCVPKAAEGEPCDSSHPSCSSGLYCAGTGAAFVDKCKKQFGPGQTCSGETSCVDGYYCDSTCKAAGPVGSDCLNSFECATGLFCAEDTQTCEAVHPAGGSCRATTKLTKSGNVTYLSDNCADGLQCVPDGSSGSCFFSGDCSSSATCCADANNKGACSTSDPFCLAPLGKCAPQ